VKRTIRVPSQKDTGPTIMRISPGTAKPLATRAIGVIRSAGLAWPWVGEDCGTG